jgi:hypothetical protein
MSGFLRLTGVYNRLGIGPAREACPRAMPCVFLEGVSR